MRMVTIKTKVITICVLWFLISNLIGLIWSIAFVSNENSEKIKEEFSLSKNAKVILMFKENGFVTHPEVRIFYIEEFEIKKLEGKIYSSNAFGRIEYDDTHYNNIFNYIWISNTTIIIIIIVIVKKRGDVE